jgi:hypothetical protein
MKALLGRWWERSQQVSPCRIAGLSRHRLIQHFGEAGYRNGAEVGVDRGRFSEWMFESIPGLHLYCVDLWWWRFRGESRYNSTVRRLEGRNATILRMRSMEALAQVPDESLDFVYIDADHTFDYVMSDIIWWARKVRMGGIVAGHDYYRFRRAGVVPAVDAYTAAHGIGRWYLTDYRKDRTPSWFWMREPHVTDPIEATREEC